MIITRNGGVYNRTQFKHFVKTLLGQIFLHNYNRQSIADLYDTIWHPDIPPDSTFKRIIVVPPSEVRETCDKINRRRTNVSQKESDIEASLIKWCAEYSTIPCHAVYTNRLAVLFFDNETALVVARMGMSEYTLRS